MTAFRSIRPGREELPAGHHLPRHRHAEGYVTVVLAGRFEEVGFAGRAVVAAGDVLVHRAFDAHANTMQSAGAWLLRLPWVSAANDPLEGACAGADLDTVIQVARRDVREAAAMLRAHLTPRARSVRDWPDLLADELSRSPEVPVSLGSWAREHGLAPATVSRGFAAVYGVSPSRFRAESRARRAWRAVVGTATPLVRVAQESGFADQAHLTRAVRAFTGIPPGAWRVLAQRGELWS